MTDRNRRMTWIGVLLAAATAALLVVSSSPVLADESAATEPTTSADWPQFRGPDRNGVAPSSPKLLERWPTTGPELLWKSEPIPTGVDGGAGSVTVAGGKALVYVHWRHKGAKNIVITTKMLNDLGWVEGIPDDLGKKVEAARAKRGNIQGEKLEAYIKDFLATLDPETAAKYGPSIQKRIPDDTFGWSQLAGLATIRDQEFASWDDFLKKAERLGVLFVFGGNEKYEAFRAQLMGQGYHYTDTIICLNAATGKEIWKKEFPGAIPAPVMCMMFGASSTPAVWNDKCYVTGSGGFYCLSVNDGSVVWQATTKFSNSSPLVYKGVVYALVPELTAFDAETGKRIWVSKQLSSEITSAVPWNSGGKDYIVTVGACVDAATGKTLWKVGSGGIGSTPSIWGDIMVEEGRFTNDGVYKITPERATFLWQPHWQDDRSASPIAYKTAAYFASGRYGGKVRCYDIMTGETKWVASGIRENGFIACTSALLVDGKVIAFINDPEMHSPAERPGYTILMYAASPTKFEKLGEFDSDATCSSSPTVANGRLFVRGRSGIACYDIAEHRPYVDGVRFEKNEFTFDLKQAEGGLAATGAIAGLVVTDATGNAVPAKAHLNGASLIVDVNDAVFPVKVTYAASGNLAARNGPLAPFEWKSPRLMFERCEGNTLVMKFAQCVDRDIWTSDKNFTVEGAKITGVELDPAGEVLRLTTDKTWKSGEKATVQYSAFLPGPSDRTAELSFVVTPGRPVTDDPVYEFLIGEFREKINPNTILEQDDLDKNTKPVAGGTWRLAPNKDQSAVIGLGEPKHNNENALEHACVYVHSETDCKVQLKVYADDGMQMIVNGKVVYTESKSFQRKDIKDVELKKGWNTLLMGVFNREGGWCFSLSIRNAQGDGIPGGLRYSAELPSDK